MFDEILADCVEALEKGATIRDCLTRYPDQATALEPLLRLAVALSRESQTRLSASAFVQGRRLLALQARARQGQSQPANRIRHRQPTPTKAAPPYRRTPSSPYQQNGLPAPRRPLVGQPVQWRVGMPRLFRVALLLLMVVGATTFMRQVATTLPGALLYPVQRGSERVVGVLMTAAGEEIAWHQRQIEQRLETLATLPSPDSTTIQAVSQAIESEWEALLIATEQLPATARAALLQSQIGRFQQLEATWVNRQGMAPQAAVTTVRRMITTGEAALARPAAAEPTATAAVAAPTLTATALHTATPTITPTALLQPSSTAPGLPVLQPSSTPTAAVSPTLPPPTATPIPPPPPTPLPEITVQMPREEVNEPESDESNGEEEQSSAAEASSPAVTNTPLPITTTPVVADELVTITPEIGPGPDEVTAPAITEPSTATVAEPTPPTTMTEEPGAPPKSPAAATATPEPAATNTPRPTNQPAATKTPKTTATPANAEPATPIGVATAPVTTAGPPTAVEKTPNPTAQTAIPTKEETVGTPISAATTPVVAPSPTPRPTTNSEATKVVQP